MSQRTPGWGRPGQPTQIPGFGGIGGVGSFPMMGVGVPLGINQAAFSQPGMLGMGVMGAAQQALAQQQRPAQNAQAGMPGGAPVAAKTRTFVGVVTKMHDSYGFVDDDVFFQHSVIRGQHPRVGEKVMVEANFNPQMPFKWNAYRIQLLSATGAQPEAPVQRRSPSPQRGAQQSSRWGPAGADRHAAPKAASPPRRRSPPRRSPVRRASPPRNAAPRRKSPVPSRRSPPASRRASPPSRKRERSPAASVASSAKRDSASPPRRRARIIPRYDFKQTKPVIKGGHVSLINLRTRYSKLYVPSDFVELSPEWPLRVPVDSAIDLTNPVQFHVFHKEVDFPESLENAVLDPEDADSRHQAKVILLAHGGKVDILKKALGLMPDGTTDDNHEVSSIFKQLQFLVGTRGKETMAIGGSWSPSLDGPDPNDIRTIIKTAIRTTKALTGVDLSGVPQWYSLVQLRYYRSDKDRMDKVHLLWPDTQLLMPTPDAWETVSNQIRHQLDGKLAAVDALTVEAPPPPSTGVTPAAAAAAPAADVKMEETPKKEPEEEAGEDGAPPEKPKPKATHWNDLDVKVMKVAELKTELEARGLETRGIKTLLASRLQEALDKEQELEEDGPPEQAAEVKDEEEKEEIMEVDSTPAEEEPKTETKSEEDIKKEAEEYQKSVEALEKEKTQKKVSLNKHFTLPTEAKIFVYPSKTAKSGKFDCKVTSLQSLLDYRHDDNKESQFEVSLFAEAFKELLERHAAFVIYQNLASAADRETEKKKREEAAVKPQENGEGAEGEESKEKTEKPEKIELKGIVANRALFEACAMFDSNLCGYFHDRDVEELLLNCDFAVSRGQVTKIVHKLCGKADRFTYRHLTDNLVDSDGAVRFEPGSCENSPAVETLIRGYGSKLDESEHISNGTCQQSDDGTVVINGNVVNVAQKLALLKKSEEERDAAKGALEEQNSLLGQLRDTKGDLEKKKKELEKELDRTKKKLTDANSSLKTAQDDVSHLKKSILDCRRFSERITSIADQACPPPKKEEKAKKEKSEEKDKKDEEKLDKPIEEEMAAGNLVLSDEAVAVELVEVDTSEAQPTESIEDAVVTDEV